MAWAAIETTGRFYVTGEMNVRFLAPAVPGDEIVARRGRAPRTSAATCSAAARSSRPTAGPILAKAEGKFFPGHAARQAGADGRALAR